MKNLKIKFSILSIFLVFFTSSMCVQAQTWEKIIDTPSQDFLSALVSLPNEELGIIIRRTDRSNPSLATFTSNNELIIIDKNTSIIKKQKTFKSNDFVPNLDTSIMLLDITFCLYDQPNILGYATIRLDTPFTFTKVFFELDSSLNIIRSTFKDTLINVAPVYRRFKKIDQEIYFAGSKINLGDDDSGIFGSLTDSLKEKNSVMLFDSSKQLFMTNLYDFVVDSNKNKYLVGTLENGKDPIQLVKLDSFNQVVDTTFITHPLLNDVHQLESGSVSAYWTSDSAFIFSAIGSILTTNLERIGDLHLFKYDTNFNFLRYRRLWTRDSSEHASFVLSTVYDSICDCFYTGMTKHENRISRTFGTGDTTEFKLVKFDKNLNILFNRSYRRNATLNFRSLSTDSKGNVIMVGETQEINYTNYWDTDIFILKVDSLGNLNSPVGLEEPRTEINRLNFRFFPNPSKGFVNFRQYNVMEDYRMDLYDSQGRILQQYRLQNSDNSIDLSDYPKGVYLYRLTDSKGRRTSGKLVRE